eukprot:1641970-Rhodomonas_salina.2
MSRKDKPTGSWQVKLPASRLHTVVWLRSRCTSCGRSCSKRLSVCTPCLAKSLRLTSKWVRTRVVPRAETSESSPSHVSPTPLRDRL